MNIVYLTLTDVSLPTGPGTNELEFISTINQVVNEKGGVFSVITNNLSKKLNRPIGNHHILLKDPFLIRGFSRLMLKIQYRYHFRSIIEEIKQKHGEIDLFICRYDSHWITSLITYMANKNIPYAIRHFHSTLSKLYKNEDYVISILKNSIMVDTTWESKVIELNKKGINHVEIFHNSVNINEFNLDKRSTNRKLLLNENFDLIIGYIGGFPLERGAFELIELAKTIQFENLKIGFLCIGDSKTKEESHYERIKKKILESNLQEKFILHGYLPYEEIPKYFHLVDIGLALVPEEVAKIFGNSSQKIFQYLASGAIPIVPEGTNLFLVEKGLAVEYIYENGVPGLEQLIKNIIYKKNKNLIYDRAERFELVKKYHSKHAEINKMLVDWLQLISIQMDKNNEKSI